MLLVHFWLILPHLIPHLCLWSTNVSFTFTSLVTDYFLSTKGKNILLFSFSTALGISHYSSCQSDYCPFIFLLTYVKCYEVLSFVHPQICELSSTTFSFWQQNYLIMHHIFHLNSVASISSLIFMMFTQYPFNSHKWMDMAGIQAASLGEF